jgi:hypothetical protein
MSENVKIKKIWNAVYNILENERQNGSLSYIKAIYQGVREDIVNFPVIILEPDSEREEQHTVPKHKMCYFTILISYFDEVINKDEQIVSERGKGVLDALVDIKNVLSKYPNLNNSCQDFKMPTTRFVFENYPYRGFEITLETRYIVEQTQR